MDRSHPTLLVADDENISLKVIQNQLKDEGYQLVMARSGTEAWALLEKKPERYATVILDWMMPGMDGMEVIEKIKTHNILNTVPVIFRTARASDQEVLQGLQAGASFYLTKPCKKETLKATIKTTVSQYYKYMEIKEDIHDTVSALELMITGYFEYQTIEDAQRLSTALAKLCPEPTKSVLGLWELLLNAVEHGNLGISYDGKTDLNQKNEWAGEIQRRQQLPEYRDKKVKVNLENTGNEIRFLIEDQGNGFDWQSYMQLSSERAFDNHGRGIAMANMQSFDKIEYKGKGNQVLAVIHKND